MKNYNEGLIKACAILTEEWKDYFDAATISESEFRPIDAFYNTLMDKFNKELMKRSVPAETLVIASEQRSDSANGVVADIVNKYGSECPSSSNCNNDGTLAEHGCNGTEEDCQSTCPVPVQCEFCYCEPKSKFNLKNDLDKLPEIATVPLLTNLQINGE